MDPGRPRGPARARARRLSPPAQASRGAGQGQYDPHVLGQYPVHVVLLSRDLAETRRFYHDQLGLEILEESPEGITFKCGGESAIAVTSSTVGTADEQTQAGWFVDHLAAEL